MFDLIKRVTLLILLSIISYAGDPCPMTFNFYDAGVPQWLDRDDILENLKADSSKTDPLLRKLMKYAKAQDCTKIQEKETSFDLAQTIKSKVFINVKSFNCNASHKALKQSKELLEGDVVLVRGSRRVLISHVGWNTVCIQASEYNGRHLTDLKLQTLFDDLFTEYIIEKYANL